MKRMIALVLALWLLIPAGTVQAEEEFDVAMVTGAWYGYDMYGQPYTFQIDPNGTCTMKKDGFDRIYNGKWTNSGRLLTLTLNSEKYYFVAEEDHLIMDTRGSMFAYDDGLFTREPFEPFEAKIKKNAPREEYVGTWELIYTYHYRKGNQYLYDDRHKAWYEDEGVILYSRNTKYVTIQNEELSFTDAVTKKESPKDEIYWKNGSYERPSGFFTYKLNILENGNLIMDDQEYEAFVFFRKDGK